MAVDLARVAAVIDRIAADVDELARARRAQAARFLNPATGAGLDAWQAERYQRGEIDRRPGYTDDPFRPR